jgi:hypothetical protein
MNGRASDPAAATAKELRSTIRLVICVIWGSFLFARPMMLGRVCSDFSL